MMPKPHGAHRHPDNTFRVPYAPRMFAVPVFTEISARIAAENGLKR